MTDSVDKLAQAAGLTRPTLLAIAEQVKANAVKLRACPRHEFAELPGSTPLKARYRCAHCDGEVDAHAYHWYQQGRQHATV
jgi:transposase-like protein